MSEYTVSVTGQVEETFEIIADDPDTAMEEAEKEFQRRNGRYYDTIHSEYECIDEDGYVVEKEFLESTTPVIPQEIGEDVVDKIIEEARG